MHQEFLNATLLTTMALLAGAALVMSFLQWTDWRGPKTAVMVVRSRWRRRYTAQGSAPHSRQVIQAAWRSRLCKPPNQLGVSAGLSGMGQFARRRKGGLWATPQ